MARCFRPLRERPYRPKPGNPRGSPKYVGDVSDALVAGEVQWKIECSATNIGQERRTAVAVRPVLKCRSSLLCSAHLPTQRLSIVLCYPPWCGRAKAVPRADRRFPGDQRRIGAPERMCAASARVETDCGHPVSDQTRVLPGRSTDSTKDSNGRFHQRASHS